MAQEDPVEPDLAHIHWSAPERLAVKPLITADIALDYFAESIFFDTKSNNNVLRTQRRVENPAYGHAEEKIELNAFGSGFEYIVAHSQPPNLFVIHRREIRAEGATRDISAAYFILHGNIYSSPTLCSVVSARLRNAAHLVSETFNTLSLAHPPANPRAPSQWRALAPSMTAEPPAASGSRHTVANGNLEEDIDMPEASAPTAPESAKPASGKSIRGPDFHLFNALQATRAAMEELDRLAAQPPRPRDPLEELRSVEEQITGKPRNATGKGSGPVKTVRHISASGEGASGTPGRIGSSPVASTATAGLPVRAGRAQSIASSAVGQSPLANFSVVT